MSLVQETDYGTPRSRATEEVRLTIDGHAVAVPAGTSIMRAAMDAGIKVPKLCATDSVEAFAQGLRLTGTVGDKHPSYRYEREVEDFFRHSPAVVRPD